MMDKDFMQLNEDQLKEISGGAFDPNEFMSIENLGEAQAYLIECGAQPGQGFYEAYLATWVHMHTVGG